MFELHGCKKGSKKIEPNFWIMLGNYIVKTRAERWSPEVIALQLEIIAKGSGQKLTSNTELLPSPNCQQWLQINDFFEAASQLTDREKFEQLHGYTVGGFMNQGTDPSLMFLLMF